jgi:hypothetical protein
MRAQKKQTECQIAAGVRKSRGFGVGNAMPGRRKCGKNLDLTPVPPNLNPIGSALQERRLNGHCPSRMCAATLNKPTVGTSWMMVV